MPNPSPNSFVSTYKNYRVYRDTPDSTTWKIADRKTTVVVGYIEYLAMDDIYYFRVAFAAGYAVYTFTELQVMDISNAIRNISRNDGGTIHKHKKKK